MLIDLATADDIRFIALNMRDRDLVEFSAVLAADTREEIADALAAAYAERGDIIVARLDNEPIAFGGLVQLRPNVGTLTLMATPRLAEISLSLTRYLKRVLFARAIAGGVHRIECASIEGYEEAHEWLRILGLGLEGTFPGYGKRGEAFLQFAWVSDVCSAGR